ncbi:hypothetical protein [Cerasicoccus arenae]|uniref:TPM domain-containing protein n=1 Tax=Cerasicoccus arenae TaxID=424488 RepID=A0A8J3DDH8_9BACT|nr:hypothetical protein [Cerasicoccus arenae]MBK1858083.1 hypothetical protein [Cerasicoccus arenae]GHC06982.1 hypothetical protein GCM10007047_25060 [Cerasicoccus arenae]
MKTFTNGRRWVILLIALLMGMAGAVYAQNANTVRINNSKSTPSIESINAKLDRIIQQQGGRYVFLISAEGDLWRLDTFTGQLAILNMVSGAEWDTLDVPEKTLRSGNAFYEQFVQKLNRINFDNN